VDGHDYRFVSKPEFDRLVDAGELLEHAKVLRQLLRDAETARRGSTRAAASDVLFEHRLAGARSSSKVRRPMTWSAFLSCRRPCRRLSAVLRRALKTRRMSWRNEWRAPADEMSHWAEYDYVLINVDTSSDRSHKCERSWRLSDYGGNARSA